MTNCERCKSERVAHATDGNTVPFIVLEAEREHHRREKRNIVVAFLIVLLALIGYITFDRYQDVCSICTGQSVDQQACDSDNNSFIGAQSKTREIIFNAYIYST